MRMPPRSDSNVSASSTILVPRPPPNNAVNPQHRDGTSAGFGMQEVPVLEVPTPLITMNSGLIEERPLAVTAPATRERTASSVSFESSQAQPQPQLHVDTEAQDTEPPPLAKPEPFCLSEARDVSASSRDSLRRHVQQRRKSLTVQEQSFLDNLVVHGNEFEIQLAFEKLLDEDLFFESTGNTPRNSVSGFDSSIRSEPTPFTESLHEANISPDDARGEAQTSPRPTFLLTRAQSCFTGSQRRLQALELRRNHNSHQLWKAHQSGLAITSMASQRSLMMRHASSVASISSTTSSNSKQQQAAIFRSRMTTASVNTDITNNIKKLPPTGAYSLTRAGKLLGPHRRSQSLIVLDSTTRITSASKTPPPGIPPPMPLGHRRTSTSGSRKSVTFHEDTVLDKVKLPRRASTGKVLRRSVSNTLDYTHPISEINTISITTANPTQLVQRLDSTGSIPSIHHAHPIRQDSIGSIPSIHHGHPIRQDSVGSIPSLRHGHPIRQDSVGSIPSLHHGHPIRQDSIGSIPSLHHAHPIQQDSVDIGRIPSLHLAHPIRSDSIGSIPSLHHAHPLRQESVGSIPSRHWDHQSFLDDSSESDDFLAAQDIKALWLQQYAASEEIASQWMDTSVLSASSLPRTVTLPMNDTETTAEETFDDTHKEGRQPEKQGNTQLLEDQLVTPDYIPKKPILMRLASRNKYEGEGIEVTVLDDIPRPEFRSLISMDASIRTCTSWGEETSQYSRAQEYPDEIFRGIRRSLSDEDMGQLFLGTSAHLLLKDISTKKSDYDKDIEDDDVSWDMNSSVQDRFDSWNVIKDEYINGYGGGGTLGFFILGTSADDEASQPHVLSPPLMESLQAFLPYSKSGENFFMKYSMVRDGASMHAFLKCARGIQYTILAIETVDGEVFGSFTAQAWRKNWNYFGTGESFLWKMRRSRLEKTHGILEQAQLESEIDVYPYTGENRYIQLCTHDRIAVGGGTPAEKKIEDNVASETQDHEWGFGLAISSDLLTGTSSPCVTFGSPSLSNEHSDGSRFEIVNMELWTLTPCMTVEEAEKLELGKLFLERDE